MSSLDHAPEVDPDTLTLLLALTSAITSMPGTASKPGQLRVKIVENLPPQDAYRLRGTVHQLVIAAEEHLPARLTSLAPVSADAAARVAAELAATRGWSYDAARRTTQLWLNALGLADDIDLAAPAGVLPQPPTILPEQRSPAPSPAVESRPAAAVAAPAIGLSPPAIGLAATSLPPVDDGRLEPFPAVAGPPEATSLPPAQTPAAGSTPAMDWAVEANPAPWPKASRRVQGLTQLTGRRAVASAQGYAGIPMMIYWTSAVLLIAALSTLTVMFTPENSAGPPLGAMLIGGGLAALLTKLVKPGVLAATEDGLEFTPFDVRMRKPKLESVISVPWSDVATDRSMVGSRVQVGLASVQLGPGSKAFAAAVASRSATQRRPV